MKINAVTKRCLGLFGVVASSSVSAALPTVTNTNAQSGNYLKMIEGLFSDAYDTGSLMIGAGIFLVVVIAIIMAFWEYHKGKRDLSDVGVVAAAGGLVMTVVVILLQNGGTII